MRTFEESWKVFSDKIVKYVNNETHQGYTTGSASCGNDEPKQQSRESKC